MNLNKPKFKLIANSLYAFEGLLDIIKHETSFKIELLLFTAMSVFILLIDTPFYAKAILFVSLFIPLMAEIANSALERVVDLVTLEYHDLAKRAKDLGATFVLFSFIVTTLIWISVLYYEFYR